ncbi:unnamed protein product, partial [Didymodactylos carnosus]
FAVLARRRLAPSVLRKPPFVVDDAKIVAVSAGRHQGRTLKSGDLLPLFNNNNLDIDYNDNLEFVILIDIILKFRTNWKIQVLLRPQSNPNYLNNNDLMELLKTKWKVHFLSKRMIIRLVGPRPIWERLDGGEGGSHPNNIHDCDYALGSIILTDAMPIVLKVQHKV